MKKIYVSAWFLLVAGVLFLAFTGAFDPSAQVVFSLIALVLVYTLAFRAALVNARESQNE